MKCKKSIMGLAALLILVFHFYIPLGTSNLEMFFYRSAYIGVDLFFFVSAYSLGTREKIKYGSFIGNRFYYIYFPFAIMALIATLYKKWSFGRFVKILTGVEFYKRGGGAFLWFVIAIMLLYLIAPLLVKLKTKFGIWALPMTLVGWLALAALFQYVLKTRTVFIMINRLPIFLIGMFYEEYRKLDWKKWKLPVALVEFVVGCVLVYKWGTTVRLSKPFFDMYYIVAIPMVVGIVGIFDALSELLAIRNVPLMLLGKITLELYGFQMIFGYDIEQKIFKLTKGKLLSFLATVFILIAVAALFNALMKLIRTFINKFKERLKDEEISS